MIKGILMLLFGIMLCAVAVVMLRENNQPLLTAMPDTHMARAAIKARCPDIKDKDLIGPAFLKISECIGDREVAAAKTEAEAIIVNILASKNFKIHRDNKIYTYILMGVADEPKDSGFYKAIAKEAKK